MFKHEMSEFFLLCLHFFLSFFTYTVYMGVFYVQVHIYCTMYLSIQRPLPHIILSVTQKLNKHLIFHKNTFIYFLIYSSGAKKILKSIWDFYILTISRVYSLFSQHFQIHWKFKNYLTIKDRKLEGVTKKVDWLMAVLQPILAIWPSTLYPLQNWDFKVPNGFNS